MRFLKNKLIIILLLHFVSCRYLIVPFKEEDNEQKDGIYHTVKKGETLWRISYVYNVPIELIAEENKILDATLIYEGQKIFIPNAKMKKEIIQAKDDISDLKFEWPLMNKTRKDILTEYGYNLDVSIAMKKLSKGIDIRAKSGENIIASESGTISYSGKILKSDKIIIIGHKDNYYTVYKNCEPFVDKGVKVKKGNIIGKIPEDLQDPFLHFEIRRGKETINPLLFLP